MTLMDIVILVLVAGVCGAIARALTGFSGGGCVVSVAIGFVGALIGLWLARTVGLPELLPLQVGPTSFPITWAIIGAALFTVVIGLFARRVA